MSDHAPVLINREGRLLRLTLNRPEKRNAINEAMAGSLLQAFEAAADDASVQAILLDAEGPVFCSGMDLADAGANDAVERTSLHERLFQIGLGFEKPIVAGVQGAVRAGGLGLVANAHIVVCSQEAKFALTEIRIGMWPFAIFRGLELAMGYRRTLELCLSGRIFSAEEARQYGLVHEVVPAFEFVDRVDSVARTVAAASGDAVRLGMQSAQRGRGLGDAGAIRLAMELRSQLYASPDFTEGVAAQHEKRAPRWPSHGA